MKKCKHSNGTSKESAKVKPVIVANATKENGYFTKCELQEMSLQRYAADFEYLRRVTSAPGEPNRFNWTHGCIRARANALLAMLAKNPANHDMRKMYEDYRSLENEVFGFANQPPYNFLNEPSDADTKLKEFESIPEIQISFDNATQFFSL